jgi:hypothetical protein
MIDVNRLIVNIVAAKGKKIHHIIDKFITTA